MNRALWDVRFITQRCDPGSRHRSSLSVQRNGTSAPGLCFVGRCLNDATILQQSMTSFFLALFCLSIEAAEEQEFGR